MGPHEGPDQAPHLARALYRTYVLHVQYVYTTPAAQWHVLHGMMCARMRAQQAGVLLQYTHVHSPLAASRLKEGSWLDHDDLESS